MPDRSPLEQTLAAATIEGAVFELRPDYRALLIAVDGLQPADSDAEGEARLQQAERQAREALQHTPVEELPHVAAWRDAYRAFGAKPQRTRNSLEALLRRTGGGLPRVNRLTDLYNAISVAHQIPLGGEDLDRYDGPAHLVRATGDERFEVMANGQPALEHPEPGEVVWRDDTGVTCRRWNWRQGPRTQLTDDTRRALFILDALEPLTTDALQAAGAELTEQLRRCGTAVQTATRLITAR